MAGSQLCTGPRSLKHPTVQDSGGLWALGPLSGILRDRLCFRVAKAAPFKVSRDPQGALSPSSTAEWSKNSTLPVGCQVRLLTCTELRGLILNQVGQW